MQLSKHIAQGKLLYLNHEGESLSVSENEHYRWLAFTNSDNEAIIQSVMHKRKPWLLTLPHQTAMLLPLLFFRPRNIVELGLGGGNLDRFLCHLSSDINITSIEYSATVIDCFEKYFNPEQAKITIKHSDSNDWLAQKNDLPVDWLLCDVYQTSKQNNEKNNQQLSALLENIDGNSSLTINLPHASDNEINLCLTMLQQLQSQHEIYYVNVPHYLNVVIHLIPKHWPLYKLQKRNKNSDLSKPLFNRWRQFWRYANKVRAYQAD